MTNDIEMLRSKRVLLFTIVVAIGAVCFMLSVCVNGFAEPREFEPRVVIRRPFPAITDPPIATVEKADDELHDNELVIGVEVGGKSRAYPINMLTGPQREIINDQLGGRAIAATW